MNIIVKESALHGLGVFACIDFAIGDVIERCPYLVIDDDDPVSYTHLTLPTIVPV